MTAVMQEMMDLKCAGLSTSGITASQNPWRAHTHTTRHGRRRETARRREL